MENFRRNREHHRLGNLDVDEFLALDDANVSYEDALSFSFTVNRAHPLSSEVIRRVTEINAREVRKDFIGSATLFALV